MRVRWRVGLKAGKKAGLWAACLADLTVVKWVEKMGNR